MKPDFLKIDQLRLDQEWLHQPRLYFEMAQELADAQLEQNRADSDLKLVAAELDLAIRENPAKFKLPDKPLEAAIKSAVLKSKSYFERQELLFKTKHRVDVLQAAVVALEHRKRSLTLLVQLHLANYFSDPKITAPRSAREAVEEQHKRAAREVGRMVGGKHSWREELEEEPQPRG